MSGWLIGLVGVIYLGVATCEYRDGNTGMALTFVGYALATSA